MKYDPRLINSFKQLNLDLKNLPGQIKPIQAKMLGSNFSGLSVLAKAAPGLGKSTAAAIALAQKCQEAPNSGLVLVPTATLASQYHQMLESLGAPSKALYRTGQVDLDEQQHQTPNTSILIATPQRLLDYLAFDPSLVPLNLTQLVVDELELFQSLSATKQVPLEQLLEYLLSVSNPQLTLITNTRHKLRFKTLESLLVQEDRKRQVVEISERVPEPQAQITVLRHNGELIDLNKRPLFVNPIKSPKGSTKGPAPAAYSAALARVWDGQALVMVPDQVTLSLGQDAVYTRYSDISGLNMNLSNLLLLGWQKDWDLEKLAYAVGNNGGKITMCLVEDDNAVLEDIYRGLDSLVRKL